MEYRPGLPEVLAKLDEITQGRYAAESGSKSATFVDLMADLPDDDLVAATDLLDSFDNIVQADEDLSQKLVSELDSSDTESHYNLGIAYKEMGLFGDAIAEFGKAGMDPARSIDCISLTGQCYLEAGDTNAALASFKSGLAHKNLSDEERMTLNFELGMLHQLRGDLLEALESFQSVAEKDSFFRDVSEHIKNLRKELGLDASDDDGGPKGNRDRVSYI
jgi:tetratricopeptide (TPR) repeat protein